MADHLFVIVDAVDGFRQGDSEDVAHGAHRVDGQFTDAATHGRLSREHRRTGHPVTACHEQSVSERALVRILGQRTQQLPHLRSGQQIAVCITKTVRRFHSNIHHLHLSVIRIVLRQKESSLHELDAEGFVGHDHRAVLGGRLVGEKSRRRVNGNRISIGSVNMADDIGIEAGHRFVEPDAEQRIHNQVVFSRLRLIISGIAY